MAKANFVWPSGSSAELKVYPESHPQRKPTEKWFADTVRHGIAEARAGGYRGNIQLLHDSLVGVDNAESESGFDSWFWAIEGVLGAQTCRDIGKRVCAEENFTVEEAKKLVAGLPPKEKSEDASPLD